MRRATCLILVFVVVACTFARVWGWSSYRRYRAGLGDHDDVACARCARLLAGEDWHSDAEYEAGVGGPDTPAKADRWNRAWARCFLVFPNYPWRMTPRTNEQHDVRDDAEAWLEGR